MNDKNARLIANLVCATVGIMDDVSGGADLSDDIRKGGYVSSVEEATAIAVKNKLVGAKSHA